MIVKSAPSPNNPATLRKIDQLYTCVRYCEDEFRCRRTMQLEFFGEEFDRVACSGTCDNCKEGRQPEKRDLTSVARDLLDLLTDVSKQKRGKGVTMLQLTELYRGSKSQSATKSLETKRLRNYGKGKKYSKSEIDRIAHALVFERILVESSVENQSGFASDYVTSGEQAGRLQSGQLRFIVEFPKALAKKAKKTSGKDAKKQETRKDSSITGAYSTKRASTGVAKKAAGTARSKAEEVVQIDDSSDDDVFDVTSASESPPGILADSLTGELLTRIKELVSLFCSEERLTSGKDLFYWNIMSNKVMKNIAAKVPLNKKELKAVGGLGDQVIKDYGNRIMKVITKFVNDHDVEQIVRNHSSRKRLKVSSGASVSSKSTEDDDEFATNIDFSKIEVPGATVSSANVGPVAKATGTSSSYFSTK